MAEEQEAQEEQSFSPPKKPEWSADEIVQRPIDKLKPYKNNPRTHSEEQVQQIANSMSQWGWTMPILIDEHDRIIAGHGRLEAAKLLHLDTAPCIVAQGWTNTQKRAYVIADNKLAENAGWDDDLLRFELDALDELDFDLSLTGFDKEEIGIFDVEEVDMPKLTDDAKNPYSQRTFTFLDEQAATVDEAIAKAKEIPGAAENTEGNESANGNALTFICQEWLKANDG